MNNSEKAGSSWRTLTTTGFSNLAIVHSVIAVAAAMRCVCPTRHPSPKKWPCARMATTASFPWSETTLILIFPLWKADLRPQLAVLGAGRTPTLADKIVNLAEQVSRGVCV